MVRNEEVSCSTARAGTTRKAARGIVTRHAGKTRVVSTQQRYVLRARPQATVALHACVTQKYDVMTHGHCINNTAS